MPQWKFIVKIVLQIILPTTVSICGGIFGTGIVSDDWSNTYFWALIVGIASLIGDIVLNIYCTKKESEYYKYKEIVNTFSNFSDEYKNLSERIYSTIQNTRSSNTIKLNARDRKVSYDFLCENLYKSVSLISEKGDNLSVSIILKESGKYIMVSHYGKFKAHPSLYNIPLSIKDANKYYYAKIIKNKKPDPKYLMNIKEIQENFYLDNYCRDKYEQYIGIPICCNGKTISGLLQVVVYKGTKITSNVEKMEKLINEIIYPYVYYALLCEKIEKIFMIGGVHNVEDENEIHEVHEETSTN